MTINHATDQLSPAATAEPAQPDEVKSSTRCQRGIERALECVDDALELDDPFEASLGAFTGKLMMMGTQISEAIQYKLGHGQPTLEEIQKVTGAIDLNLKVARQFDRLLHLRNREQDRKKP